jgi:hypothetical protein
MNYDPPQGALAAAKLPHLIPETLKTYATGFGVFGFLKSTLPHRSGGHSAPFRGARDAQAVTPLADYER